MPDSDNEQETWEPRRGSLFKVVAWVLLVLIAGGVVTGLVILLAGR